MNTTTEHLNPWNEPRNLALNIPQQPQRQDSLLDQLQDLRVAARRLGCYDADDYLRQITSAR